MGVKHLRREGYDFDVDRMSDIRLLVMLSDKSEVEGFSLMSATLYYYVEYEAGRDRWRVYENYFSDAGSRYWDSLNLAIEEAADMIIENVRKHEENLTDSSRAKKFLDDYMSDADVASFDSESHDVYVPNQCPLCGDSEILCLDGMKEDIEVNGQMYVCSKREHVFLTRPSEGKRARDWERLDLRKIYREMETAITYGYCLWCRRYNRKLDVRDYKCLEFASCALAAHRKDLTFVKSV